MNELTNEPHVITRSIVEAYPIWSVMAGGMTALGGMAVSSEVLPAGDRMSQRDSFDDQIRQAKNEQAKLSDASQLLEATGNYDEASSVSALSQAKASHAAELRSQKDEIGHEFGDAVQTVALPLALGVAVTALVGKRLLVKFRALNR